MNILTHSSSLHSHWFFQLHKIKFTFDLLSCLTSVESFQKNRIFNWLENKYFIRLKLTVLYRHVRFNIIALATCGYWALEKWLAQTDMCYHCKIHTGFRDMVWKKKNTKYSVNIFIMISAEMIVFYTDLLSKVHY